MDASVGLEVPALQGKHLAEPLSAWYRPVGQAVQFHRSFVSVYLPAAQATLLVSPKEPQCEPGGQSKHAVEPLRFVNFPFSQSEHADSRPV